MPSLAAMLLLFACTEQGISTQVPQVQGDPAVEVSPSTLDLGILQGGERAEAALMVKSVGDVGLTVYEIALADATPGLALQTPALPTVLPPGSQLSALVSFEAHTTQASGTVEVHTDDPASPLVEVPVVASAELAWLVIDPDPLDFGLVVPGSAVEDQVQLLNQGNLELRIETMVLLADAVELVEPPTLPMTLAPGASVPLALRFSPLTRVDELAQLWVGSNSWLGDTMGTVTGHGGWPGISGRVCDPSGDGWVIDAVVWARIDLDHDGTEDWQTEARTDSEGRYTLQDVPPGTWTVSVQKGSYSTSFEVTVPESGGVYEVTEETCLDPDSVTLAVVTGEYDHVESLVSELGLNYDTYDGTAGFRELLADPDKLATYDVLFLNCGDYRSMEDELDADAVILQQFVAAGGSVYASDWASLVVEHTWPELVDLYGTDDVFESTAVGVATRIEADVTDTIMAYAVGSTRAEIVYDLDAWIVPLAEGADTDVLVRGTVPTFTGVEEDVPLAMRYHPGGRVIFTTFHNEQQLTEDMEAALEEIILSL